MSLSEDQIQFCLGRIKSVAFMICEGDEDCESLIAYALKDLNERLEAKESIFKALDEEERMVYYYIQRDYPNCKICEKAWREAFRTLRYCLKRQFLQII